MEYLLIGLVIGFAVAAPVGPVGLLCIRRSLLDGRFAGFITGLGAATADGFFGLIAALGLTSVTAFLSRHSITVQTVGGIALVVIGIATMRSHPTSRENGEKSSLPGSYFSTIAITLANPMTIAGFIGIFSSFGIGLKMTDTAQIFWLVIGVFLGSAAWWFLLSSLTSWLRKRFPDGGLHVINLGAGLAIVACGLWQFVKLSRHYFG
ncbi:MAG: LysE family transporter [Verrucomicrobiota bacterium]|nr:LysE family transporter [Verrucomicrobiota bacterium]